MKKSIKQIIAVILTLMMAISTMPITALATTVGGGNSIYYADFDYDGTYEWYFEPYGYDDCKINDGYVELEQYNSFTIQNQSSSNISITNNIGYDFYFSYDSISSNGSIPCNNYSYDGSVYFILDGNSITIQTTVPCRHTNLTYVDATNPTLTESGYKAHYVCNECGEWFSDSAAKNKVSKDSLFTQYALGGDVLQDNMSFYIRDGVAWLHNYIWSEFSGKDMVIPSTVTYNGTNYTVAKIDNVTFKSDINSVTIPKTVTKLNSTIFKISLSNVKFEDASTLSDVYYTTLQTADNTSTSSATVNLQGFRNGKSVSEYVYRGELLKPVLSGYTGSNSLLYTFTCSNSEHARSSLFQTANLYNQTYGYYGGYMSTESYYGIRQDADATDIVTCDVYEIIQNEDGTATLSKIATTSETLSNLTTDYDAALSKA